MIGAQMADALDELADALIMKDAPDSVRGKLKAAMLGSEPLRPVARSGKVIVLDVLGVPAPKGSSRAVLIAGRARLIAGSSDTNKRKQKHWADAVREVALAQPDGFKATPLAITIEFRMPRIKGHYGTGRNASRLKPGAPPAPAVLPDLDKLTRCTLDAIVTRKTKKRTFYGIIDDDSRIVQLAVTKIYAAPGQEGARITVEEWRPTYEAMRASAPEETESEIDSEIEP